MQDAVIIQIYVRQTVLMRHNDDTISGSLCSESADPPIRWTSCNHFFARLAIFIYFTIKMFFFPSGILFIGDFTSNFTFIDSFIFVVDHPITLITRCSSLSAFPFSQVCWCWYFRVECKKPPANNHKDTNQYSQQITQKQRFYAKLKQVKRENIGKVPVMWERKRLSWKWDL